MKYKSVNDLKTIALKDARLTLAVMSSDQLRLNVEGPVIRGDNPNNNRYEDMYCVLMELLFDQVDVKGFVLQGYKYYDADGKLLETVPDRPLTPQEQRDSLLFNDNAWVFSLDQNEDGISALFHHTLCSIFEQLPSDPRTYIFPDNAQRALLLCGFRFPS